MSLPIVDRAEIAACHLAAIPGSPAPAPHAGDVVEAAVARHDVQTVLDSDCADPDVVLGDRRTLRAKRRAHGGITGVATPTGSTVDSRTSSSNNGVKRRRSRDRASP